MRKFLLGCGGASSVLYVLTDLLGGLHYPGYSFVSQGVSELMAIGSPVERTGRSAVSPLRSARGGIRDRRPARSGRLAGLALDKRFRVYSFATVVLLVVFGAIAGAYSGRLAAQQPTAGLGIYERISIYSYLLWVVVLAGVLRRRPEGTR
ncbi:MAG TPA: hypothetical protein VH539_05045 [Gemmatimonadaceae bacterium]